MDENKKTAIFAGVAVAVLLVAWLAQSSLPTFDPDEEINQPLVETFEPSDATEMKIVTYDESTAESTALAVARTGQTWCLPTKSDYPADDKGNRMGKAAAAMLDLTILQVKGDSEGDHKTYGLIDPSDPETKKKVKTGVGMRVTLLGKDLDSSGEKKEVLVDMIVGNKVEGELPTVRSRETGEEETPPEVHYVRRVGQNRVYVVAITPESFSTNWLDWIEDDLLKLNPSDIQRITFHDYRILPVIRGNRRTYGIDERGRITLLKEGYSWKLGEDVECRISTDGQTPVVEEIPRELAEDEELDRTRLGKVETALDNLAIVDVHRKPDVLSSALKVSGTVNFERDESEQDVELESQLEEAVHSLRERGFFPTQDGEVLSSEGEIRVLMNDGVEYILRFGGMVIDASGKAIAEEADAGEGEEETKEGEEKDSSVSRRCVLVTAVFNGEAIPLPKLQDVPQMPPEDEAASEQTLPEEATPETTTPEAATPEAATPEGAAADEASPAEDATVAEGEEKEGESPEAEPEKPEEPKKTRKEILEEQGRITKENLREQELYDKKLRDGEAHVAELNARFADWYYIISNGVYKDIRLSRAELIKKIEKPAEPEMPPGPEGPGPVGTEPTPDTDPTGPSVGPEEQPPAGTPEQPRVEPLPPPAELPPEETQPPPEAPMPPAEETPQP